MPGGTAISTPGQARPSVAGQSLAGESTPATSLATMRERIPSQHKVGTCNAVVSCMRVECLTPLCFADVSNPHETCSGTVFGVQEAAVAEYLRQRKAEHVREVDKWREAYKMYRESAKMDQLRIGFLADAGVTNVLPQVRALAHRISSHHQRCDCVDTGMLRDARAGPAAVAAVHAHCDHLARGESDAQERAGEHGARASCKTRGATGGAGGKDAQAFGAAECAPRASSTHWLSFGGFGRLGLSVLNLDTALARIRSVVVCEQRCGSMRCVQYLAESIAAWGRASALGAAWVRRRGRCSIGVAVFSITVCQRCRSSAAASRRIVAAGARSVARLFM